jgi:histidinol-phosphate/aromatic aminotransferase/cobyric acid decarboxylase-like protein
MPPAEGEARQVHGGLPLRELSELGIEGAAVLDLSTNLSPFGAHPDVLRAVHECDLESYPDPACGAAKLAIARALDEDPARLMLGNGSVELLWSLIAGLGEPGRPLLVVSPTFGEPQAAARSQGLLVAHASLREERAFEPEARAISDAIRSANPFAVYLCHPNNPTGAALELDELAGLLAGHPRVPFILDEAFLSLSERHADATQRLPPNAIRVRSLTKDHSLAGLRVGYAIAASELARKVEANRPPWTVSAPAQVATVAAMAHPEHVASTRARLLELKAVLAQALSARGFRVLPSVTGFFLAEIPGHEHADALRARLLARHRVNVRSGTSFGLPRYLRFPACVPEARARLLEALLDRAG